MKFNRRNKNLITKCLVRYAEESGMELVSKHFIDYHDPIYAEFGDIDVYCVFRQHKYSVIRTYSITLSGRELLRRYGEVPDE